MHFPAQLAALAALGLISAVQAVPVIDALAAARVFAAGSWRHALPPSTVVTETFTISLGPSSAILSGSASVPTAGPTLSSVLATFTIPYGNTSTTLLHTFTYTPAPGSSVSSTSAATFPTTSVSMSPLPRQSLSVEPASVSSLDSVFRSFMSDMSTATSDTQSMNTLPALQPSQDEPKSLITASFTVTLPTGKPAPQTESFVPTHSGPMITASFTLTLPAATDTTTPCETSTASTASETTCTTSTVPTTTCTTSTLPTTTCTTSTLPTTTCTTSISSSLTTMASSNHTTHTWPETRTYTLSTEITITLSPTAPTAASTPGPSGLTGTGASSPAPSGTEAITLTYTLPAGPGRTSQVVTITTVRPAGPASTGVGSAISGLTSSATHISSMPAPATTGVAATGTVSPRPGTVPPHPGTVPPHSGTVSPRPGTVSPRPGTVSPRPSTMRPRPSTVRPRPSTGRPRSSLSWTFSGNSSSYFPATSGTGVGAGTAVPSVAPTGMIPDLPFPMSTSRASDAHTIIATATATATQVVVITRTRTHGATHGVTHAERAASFTPPATRPLEETTVLFTILRANPTPAASAMQDTTEVQQAPACVANHLTMDFDFGSKRAASLLNDPDHEMRFGTGFSRIVGKKGDPFKPSSRPGLMKFVPNHFGGATAGTIRPVGTCMRFSLNSFMVGCSTMYAECRVNVTGVRAASGVDQTVASKLFTVPSTEQLVNNEMQLINMDSSDFTNLTSAVVSIEVVGGPPYPSWYMDDLDVDLLCDEPACLKTRNVQGVGQKNGTAVPFWRRKTN